MEIIKKGNSYKEIECPYCKALLKYNGADVERDIPIDCKISNFTKSKKIISYTKKIDRIKCPECGRYIIENTFYVKSILPNLIGY